MGQDALATAIREDFDLLQHFGLRLLSVEGPITAAVESEVRDGAVNPWNVMTIENKTWDWLRPILLERRASGKTSLKLAAK
jgi:hypothetical protein